MNQENIDEIREVLLDDQLSEEEQLDLLMDLAYDLEDILNAALVKS